MLGRSFRLLAAACGLVAWVVILSWLIGRVASDRWLWSQFLFWIPTVAVIVAAGGLTIVGLALRLVARVLERSRRCRRRCVSVPLIVSLAGVTVYFAVAECRLLAAVPGAGQAADLRVVFWNPSSWVRQGIVEALMPHAPDLAIVVNAPAGVRWRRLAEVDGEPRDVAFVGRFHMVSSMPILRRGGTPLGLDGRVPHPKRHRPGAPQFTEDPGWAAFVEIESPHGLLVVWAIDLPSDMHLARRDIADRTLAAIEAWRDADGLGFPAPDLIVGDFNMTRGSWALRRLIGDLEDAFIQAGRGYAATWPRVAPIIHIDQAFVAPPWRAVNYAIIDPGTGTHRMIRLDLAVNDDAP